MPPPGIADDRSDQNGIISGTFPSIDMLIGQIFGGCCCVSVCDEQQKEATKAADYQMGGGPCCPPLDPPSEPKTPPPEDPDAEPAEPAEPDPPGHGGTCELIKLQIAMHGNPYLGFALGFEPILNMPPDIPAPPMPDASLFGIPPLNIPSMPMPDPLPPIGELPEIPLYYPPLDGSLPELPLNIPSFPGFGLFTFSLFPVKLGLDLISLKPPAIPGIDCPSLLQFTTLVTDQDAADAKCGPGIPPAEFNMGVCWLCILCFFLLIVLPLLVILLGMKQKGLFDEITDEDGNINWLSEPDNQGNSELNFTTEMMPPPVNIIHSAMDAGEADGEKHNQFFRRENRAGYSGNVVKLQFQASIHYIKNKFNINYSDFGDDIPAEPNVEVDTPARTNSGGLSEFPGEWYIKWEIFGPPGDREEPIGSTGPSEQLLGFMVSNTLDADGEPLDPSHEDYVAPDFDKFMNGDEENNITGFKSIFDNFKNSISPSALENMEDRMVFSAATMDMNLEENIRTFRPWRQAKPRVNYTFDRDGFYEIYCTVEKEGVQDPVVFMATVLIGPKPEMPTELPPILNILRAPQIPDRALLKTPFVPEPPEPEVPQRQPEPEPQPDPPATPEERIKI